MSLTRAAKSLSISTVVAATLLTPALAQFGLPMNLPQNDFRWVWGRNGEDALTEKFQDFSVRGGESGFNCELKGKLSVASGLSRMDVRNLESDLQTSMFFIQSSANAMYALDQRRDIDWAVLECQRFQAGEPDAEESQAREDKARERAERRRERRRGADGLPEGLPPRAE